jgi:hypothetical protein
VKVAAGACLLLFGAAGALAVAASCGGGGDPVCGDGVVQDGEQCDDGNDNEEDYCRACFAFLPPRTIVKWSFNAAAAPGFTQDACVDVGASSVRVTMSGPTTVTLDDMCSTYQVVFDDLPPGVYTAAVEPLDADGNLLVDAPVMAEVTAGTADVEQTIDIPFDAWVGPYTGTFYFKVHFQGMDCAPAGVNEHRITMRVNGTLVSQMTEQGQRLDGSEAGPCVNGNGMPQKALGLPFGPATIEIEGIDTGGTDAYIGSFETFVGAGANNPPIDFDVPTIYDAMPPDAGIDAL